MFLSHECLQFDDESVLVPKETSWFGYFPDGAWEPVLPAQEVSKFVCF